MLEVQGVFKSYATPQGPLAVLQGVDLHLGQGSSLALMGESGSGKSTLLHLVACLLYTSPSPRDRQKSRMPSSA